MDLRGKVALVTGGSRGIGRAISIRLAREGAAVAINYRDRAAQADEVCREITAASGRAIAVQADVAQGEGVAAMHARVVEAFGPVDILVNNAGVLRRGDLGDFDIAGLDPMRRTNVDGVVHCTRAVIGSMKERGFGRIVNISSIAAFGTSLAGTTFYAATKAAVSILTRRFAMELGPYGITVNAVAPGFVPTDMAQDADPVRAKETADRLASRAMVGRVGQTEDIAHAVAFFASPASGFITAQILAVDGGRMDFITHA